MADNFKVTQLLIEVVCHPPTYIIITQGLIEICNFPKNRVNVTQMCIEVMGHFPGLNYVDMAVPECNFTY